MTTGSGSGILGALSESSAVITLALEIGGELVPIFKGAINEIKQIAAGQDSVSYSVLIQGDQADLATVDSVAAADLVAINAELTRLGKPPLPVPPAKQPPSAT